MEWFLEDPWILIATGLVVASWFGWQFLLQGTRGPLIMALLLAIPCATIGAAAALIQTDREAVREELRSLAWAIQRHDPTAVEFVSQRAPELKADCKKMIDWLTISSDMRLWDWDIQVTNESTLAKVGFRAGATVQVRNSPSMGDLRANARFMSRWVRENGQWKLVEVQRLHPVHGDPIGLFDSSGQ